MKITHDWMDDLSLAIQGVLVLALRGPDGAPKECLGKELARAMRAVVLRGAHEKGNDDFMGDHSGIPRIEMVNRLGNRLSGEGEIERDMTSIKDIIEDFAEHHDEYPHHWLMHLVHAAEIVGYLHPDVRVREFWGAVYLRMVRAFHMQPEDLPLMLERLKQKNSPHADLDFTPCPVCNHAMHNHKDIGCMVCLTFRLGHGMRPDINCLSPEDVRLQRAYAKEHV